MSLEFPYFDHFAIGVEEWSDSYPEFVSRAGGIWDHGGDAGEYSPIQLNYAGGLTLEFISPGHIPHGFMSRFLSGRGPGPHHLTFKVASIQVCLDHLQEFGISALNEIGGHPIWREVFIHPKTAGTGTLLQLVESDEIEMNKLRGQPPPPGFPFDAPPPLGIAWVGLTVDSVDLSRSIFIDVLGGTAMDEGSGWFQVGWHTGRVLIVREAGIYPVTHRIWQDKVGVSNLTFGPIDVPVSQVTKLEQELVQWPHNPRICTNVWEIREANSI